MKSRRDGRGRHRALSGARRRSDRSGVRPIPWLRPSARRARRRKSPPRRAVARRAMDERLLRVGDVFGAALPDLERRLLDRARIRERDRPRRRGGVPRVDRVQPRGRELRRLAAGQERDPGHLVRHGPQKARDGRVGDRVDVLLRRRRESGQHHVRLQQHPVERDALRGELREDGVERRARHLVAARERMVAVHQDLRLDDRHDAGLLAERRVARERVRVDVDAGRGRDAVADRDHRAPLREAGAERRVLREPLAQPVEPFGDLLVGMERERLRAGVDLDAGHDAEGRQRVGERDAGERALPDRLVEQDRAADRFGESRRGDDEVAPPPPHLLGRRDALLDEALVAGPGALVHRDQALVVGDEGSGGGGQRWAVHGCDSSNPMKTAASTDRAEPSRRRRRGPRSRSSAS